MRYYSPSTGGFYDDELHGKAMPDDVVKISKKRHAELLEQHAAGATIVAGPKGPRAIMATSSIAEQLAVARRRVKREARRRILAIASLERQSNDTAAIALAALQEATGLGITVDFMAALDRREKIDAVRVASNAIELELEGMKADELAAFRPADCLAWPTFEETAR